MLQQRGGGQRGGGGGLELWGINWYVMQLQVHDGCPCPCPCRCRYCSARRASICHANTRAGRLGSKAAWPGCSPVGADRLARLGGSADTALDRGSTAPGAGGAGRAHRTELAGSKGDGIPPCRAAVGAVKGTVASGAGGGPSGNHRGHPSRCLQQRCKRGGNGVARAAAGQAEMAGAACTCVLTLHSCAAPAALTQLAARRAHGCH